MQITVFGASGKVGRQVVALALEHGHTVKAFVHSHDLFQQNDRLTVIKGDVTDQTKIAEAIDGSQVVVSALGSWGTKTKDVVSTGIKNIIPAMERQGIRRLITLTGAGALWSGDKPGLVTKGGHFLMSLASPKVLKDSEEHLRLLDASRLDWTCVRSPVMTKSMNSSYRLSLKLPPVWALVPRTAVAKCIVDLAENQEFPRQAPVIHKT